MKTYTLKEVSKKINVNPGKLRQWEKDLADLLEIQRTKQGARIYTELEIEQLQEIKNMNDKKYSKDMIREQLEKKLDTVFEKTSKPTKENLAPVTEDITKPVGKNLGTVTEDIPPPSAVSLEVISDKENSVSAEETAIQNANLFFDAMDQYKSSFLSEVKEEIRSVVRKEVLEEVKKEITKGTFYTVKSLSDSIYKSSANTQAEIQELSGTIEKASELTADSLQYLSNNIANVSIETTEEIYSLSKQLSETSEELSHYVGTTNNEISSLTEAINKEHELFVEDRNQYRRDVRQREAEFQQLLTGFRHVAAAKEKKWWKFWA